MSKVRILFLGTPEIARDCLQAMLADEHYEIVAVVTQPDRPAGRSMRLTPSAVKVLALENGLQVFTPESVNTPEFLAQIKDLQVECGVVVAFGQLLGDAFLGLFPKGCVNIHGSILPRWRGAAPIQRSLMAGDAETGVSLQMIVRKLDAGPVLGIRRLPLPDEMDAVDVFRELTQLGCELLHIELMDYLRGNLVPVPQDETHVTIAPKIQKIEAKVDFRQPARSILNQVRGLAVGPVAWCQREGKVLKLIKVKVAKLNELEAEFGSDEIERVKIGIGVQSTRKESRAPEGHAATVTESRYGTVALVSKEAFYVVCGDSPMEGAGQVCLLKVTEVQPESRSRMSAAEYLAGRPMQVGEVLQ